MPQVEVDGLMINYDVQGEGEPLLLIPYRRRITPATRSSFRPTPSTSAASRSTSPARVRATSRPGRTRPRAMPTRSPRSSAPSASSAPTSPGVSLGAAVGMHLAARHPARVRSLSLHSGWHASDPYLKSVVEQWRTMASALPTVADVVIQGMFPWCFTPEMYVDRPEFVDTLVDFVRSRPAQPVDAFLAQIDAVIAHDASAALREIDVPTLITFGARDLVCSTRFAEPLTSGIRGSELVVFEHLSHAGLHEDPESFNRATLDFLLRQRS